MPIYVRYGPQQPTQQTTWKCMTICMLVEAIEANNQNKQKQKPKIKNKATVHNPTPKNPKQNKTEIQKHKHKHTQKQHVPANQPGLSKCGASRASRDNCLGSASIGFHPSFLLFRPVVPRLKQIANLLVYMSPAPGKNDRFCY